MADERFTREMALTMTPEEIRAFWIKRQEARRDAGADYYTALIDPVTDEVLETICSHAVDSDCPHYS